MIVTPAPPIGKPPTTRPTMPALAGKPPAAPASNHARKTFSVQPWSGSGEGEKIVLYGPSGFGKTTLATMAPNAIFIGVDDGGRKVKNPKTGADVNAITGVETFRDLRDALHQLDLFPTGCTLVIDTITKVEALAEQYTFETVKSDGGKAVTSIEGYGFGKGYRHLLDSMRLLLADMDTLVRRGVNVLLLAQQANVRIANPEGADYIQEAPKLVHTNNASIMGDFFEWSDHVFRLGYSSLVVTKENVKATKGKASGSADRVVFTTGDLHFKAKNRMNGTLPSPVAFAEPGDDSIWQFVFHGATV